MAEDGSDTTNVSPWVRKMTEDILGSAPVEVGKFYQHPTDGKIQIVSGQYWGRNGLSNHWSWKVIRTGEIKHGYGEPWPMADSEDAARMRHPAGKRIRRNGDD